MFVGERRGALGRIAALLAGGLLVALFVAPHANGQAALRQYIQPPVPQPPIGGGGAAGETGGGKDRSSNAGNTGAAGVGAVAGETGSGSGGGTLPFTGYPVTPLVLIALALLCAGLVVRWATRVARRMRA